MNTINEKGICYIIGDYNINTSNSKSDYSSYISNLMVTMSYIIFNLFINYNTRLTSNSDNLIFNICTNSKLTIKVSRSDQCSIFCILNNNQIGSNTIKLYRYQSRNNFNRMLEDIIEDILILNRSLITFTWFQTHTKNITYSAQSKHLKSHIKSDISESQSKSVTPWHMRALNIQLKTYTNEIIQKQAAAVGNECPFYASEWMLTQEKQKPVQYKTQKQRNLRLSLYIRTDLI